MSAETEPTEKSLLEITISALIGAPHGAASDETGPLPADPWGAEVEPRRPLKAGPGVFLDLALSPERSTARKAPLRNGGMASARRAPESHLTVTLGCGRRREPRAIALGHRTGNGRTGNGQQRRFGG